MTFKFLRNDGQFQQVNGGDIGISTTTTTAFLTYVTNTLASSASVPGVGFVDGPSVSAGSSGTWFVAGSVTMITSIAGSEMILKLWDGTTVLSGGIVYIPGVALLGSVALSGIISNPAGNLRISTSAAAGNCWMTINATGTSKDSTIYATRIG